MLRRTALCLLSMVMICACTTPANSTKPVVGVISPPDGAHFAPGEVIQIRIAAAASNQVRRIELRENGNLVAHQDNPAPALTYSTQLQFVPTQAGSITLTVNALDITGASSDSVSLVVYVGSTSGLLSTATPASLQQNSTGETQPTPCTLTALFVTDVTIPDNTIINPGLSFVKTWRIRNTSDCAWEQGYELAFIEGSRMDAPGNVPVPPTARDASIDVSVPFTAPMTSGVYTSTWRMRAPSGGGQNGGVFGNRVYVVIRVP